MEVKKIYFDMDGVLADFARGLEELCRIEPLPQELATREYKEKMYAAMREVPHFYGKLEMMPGAMELFRPLYARYGSRCEILSGVPKPHRGIPEAGEDKTEWVHRLLAPDLKVNITFKELKYLLAEDRGCILIDDYERNIREWEEAGGTGILHRSTEGTLARLRELGVL